MPTVSRNEMLPPTPDSISLQYERSNKSDPLNSYCHVAYLKWTHYKLLKDSRNVNKDRNRI